MMRGSSSKLKNTHCYMTPTILLLQGQFQKMEFGAFNCRSCMSKQNKHLANRLRK